MSHLFSITDGKFYRKYGIMGRSIIERMINYYENREIVGKFSKNHVRKIRKQRGKMREK